VRNDIQAPQPYPLASYEGFEKSTTHECAKLLSEAS